MPVKEYLGRITTSDEATCFNRNAVRRRFACRPVDYVVIGSYTTSDISDSSDVRFWGTPEDWRVLDADSMPLDEFDDLAAFLRDSGHASM